MAPGGVDPAARATTWPRPWSILTAGTRLTPAAIALAAGAGNRRRRRSIDGPVVGVLATGDEVRRPGRDARAGGDPRRERARARARSPRRPAPTPIELGIAADRLEDVRARLLAARAGEVDAMIVVGRRLGRAVRRRPGGVRGDRPDRAVAGGRPARQAVRVRGRRRRRRRADRCCSACRATRCRRFVTFELFVRPAIRRLAGLPADRLVRSVDRAVLARGRLEEPGPARRSCGSSPSGTRPGPTVRDAAGPGAGPARRWGPGRGATSCRRWRRRTRSAIVPEAVDAPAGGRRGRPVVARPGLTGGPSASGVRRPGAPGPRYGPMAKDAAPRAERRRLTHVDRSRPAADGRRVARSPSTARRAVAEAAVAVSRRDDEPGDRRRRAEGRRPRRRGARRRHGRQADERADPALPSARR